MGKPIKLSLREEIEREVKKIEEDMANCPELENIKVTDEMDAAFWKKIREYEEEKAEEEELERYAEEMFRKSKGSSIFENASENMEKEDLHSEADIPDENTEFSEELAPDFSIIHGSGEERFGNGIGENAAENMDSIGEIAGGKILYRRKKKKYLFISLVAVLVIIFGVGVTSVGSKSYWKVLWERATGGEPMKVLNVEDMESRNTEDVDEMAAYGEIEEKLHVTPIKLAYKPVDMELEAYSVDEKMLIARFRYIYQDEIIRYTIYINDNDSSWGQNQEDIKTNEFTIRIDDIEINIEEFEIDDGINSRYEANFEYQGVHYQLKGIIEKKEFEKILNNLYFS